MSLIFSSKSQASGRSLTFAAFILTLFLVACQTETTPTSGPEPQATPTPEAAGNTAELGQPFTLAVGESATIGETALTLTFEEILLDGRCPSAVNCAADGPVIAFISVRRADETPSTFEMNPDPQKARLAGIPPNIVTLDPYEIELTAVEPHPEQPEDLMNLPYTAAFIVR
jgi:hypothetical protein